ncbi:MAG: MmcQ/YjbR family DNA-binding protein [Xanthobacteraceae bacterium]|uniref:MmcQ/YjbR family DNA-binding protein n=1 Tax=Pseudolabrys sp. TaxID=1960880 RepID=UPI003D09757F
MVSAAEFRKLALQFEGVEERPHFDRAAFRVVRNFATLAPDKKSVNFKFAPDEQAMKCAVHPQAFSPVPNAWGAQGWTTAVLSKLTAAEARDALALAFRHAQPKPKKRSLGKSRR